MENEKTAVEIVHEPKIEKRFGFSHPLQAQSSKTIKICACATVATLSALFLLRSPEQDVPQSRPIDAPETQNSRADMSEYSASKNSLQNTENLKKTKPKKLIKIPGIQKIERRAAGSIPAGTTVKSALVTPATDGVVQARTEEAVRLKGETLLPAGSLIVGIGVTNNDRLIVHFTRMVDSDGSNQKISAQALDASDNLSGLAGSKFGRATLRYATAVGLNFAGGMAEGLQEREAVGQQVVPKSDPKNALLHGASKAALDAASETSTNFKNHPPSVKIPADQEFVLVFDGGE